MRGRLMRGKQGGASKVLFEGTPPNSNRVEEDGDEWRGVVSPLPLPLPLNVNTWGGGRAGKGEGGSTPVSLREDGRGAVRSFEATNAKVGSGTFDHFLVVGAEVENRSEKPHVYNNIIDEITGNIKAKGIPGFFGLGGKKSVAKGTGQSVVKPTVLMHYAAKDGFKGLPSSPDSIANFCFPRGIKVKEVNVKESMSDVNAIFYGPHCHRGDGSFIFTFNDDTGLVDGQTNGSTLYGVCATQPRLVGSLEVPRVYCILTRIPHFELHFRVLWDVIAAQRIGRLPMEGGVGADKHGYDTLDFIKQTFIRYSTVNIDGGVGEFVSFQVCNHLPPITFRPVPTINKLLKDCTTSTRESIMYNGMFGGSRMVQSVGGGSCCEFKNPWNKLRRESISATKEWSLPPLFSVIPADILCDVLGELLKETQLVVLSERLSMLSSAVLGLVYLLKPQLWVAPMIPLLPHDMEDFMQAPVPYIIGFPGKDLPNRQDLQDGVGILNLDAGNGVTFEVAGSCQPRRSHAHVELFFINQLLARFPNLISFGGVFDMCVTDAYYPFSPGVLSTLRRTITSIKLNLDLPPLLGLHAPDAQNRYSISQIEQQFDHKFPNLFPNLTHITISDDHSKPDHNVTKTIMDAIVRNFPNLKSVCFSMPNFYRFTSYSGGAAVEGLERQQADSLKHLLHLPNLECFNINGTSEDHVVFMGGDSKKLLYPNILSLIPAYNTTLTSLSLRSCQQFGQIPKAIFTLTRLQKLDLSNNKYGAQNNYHMQLTGDGNTHPPTLSIPKDIGELKNLRMLKLNDNMFSGNIPSTLYDLTKLEHLHLDQNYIVGTLSRKIGQLTKLRVLVIKHRNQSASSLAYFTRTNPGLRGSIPGSLSNCKDLIGLQIHGTFTGSVPKSLGSLTKLRCLEFCDPANTRKVYEGARTDYDRWYKWAQFRGPNIPRGWDEHCWDVCSRHMIFEPWESTQVQAFLAFLRGDDETLNNLLKTIKWGNESGRMEDHSEEGSEYNSDDQRADEESMAESDEEMEYEFLHGDDVIWSTNPNNGNAIYHSVPDYVKVETVHSTNPNSSSTISRPYLMYEMPYQTTGLTDSEDEDDESYELEKDPDLNLSTTQQINQWNPDVPELVQYTNLALNTHDVNSSDDDFNESGFDEMDPLYNSDDYSTDDDYEEGKASTKKKFVSVVGGFVTTLEIQEDDNPDLNPDWF
ncbi:hypothetical protein TrRE_jg12431 [Triparma retinervis]|uniref:UDENN domain-containing protein n=1 Tax=Triparma retinervis TaxID=2557542 RepID=A0A9W7G9H1_9STRA|nr:hypothetical protein TrRE_jg12431 [Triparma retinervis]